MIFLKRCKTLFKGHFRFLKKTPTLSRTYRTLTSDDTEKTNKPIPRKLLEGRNSSSAHLFAIRGKRKRGPGTLQTRD